MQIQGGTFSFSRASLIGRVVRGMAAEGWGVLSAMAGVCTASIGGFGTAFDGMRGCRSGRR
jgi:hypothetical protein